MATSTKDILQRLAGRAHRGGAFNSDVLIAISEVLPSGDIKTLETGCGKSTIMFSNLAAKHVVFAYDDRDMPDSSVGLVQKDPEFKADRTEFVYGPTQQTLLVHQFADDDMFDVILIDGPHGYPFPDLEYAILYERLKPGGILIIDDVHIPSIGNMYDLLREDRMYEEIGVFATTGLLKRTEVEGVPADGDHWFEQSYNYARFPLGMEKYNIDRTLTPDGRIDLTNGAHLSQYVIKSIESAATEKAARTIDIGASLEVFVPESVGTSLTIELEYKSIYADAAKDAVLMIGSHREPLPYSKRWSKIKTVVPRPEGGRLIATILHPHAIPEHDRDPVATRYEFRRLGSFVRAFKVTGSKKGTQPVATPMPDTQSAVVQETSHSEDFKVALVEIGKDYPYQVADKAEIIPRPVGALGEAVTRVQRLLQRKLYWSVAELLAFDGTEFADAIAYALQGREATEAESHALDRDNSAPVRLRMILELDNANRKSGNPARVMGIRKLRNLWRLERLCTRNNIKPLKKLFASQVRKEARRIHHQQISQISTIQYVHAVLDRMDMDAGRVKTL